MKLACSLEYEFACQLAQNKNAASEPMLRSPTWHRRTASSISINMVMTAICVLALIRDIHPIKSVESTAL